MMKHCFLLPLDEVPANAGASSSESTLNDYVYFTIAVALVIVAARRYVGTITEKLKATCGYAKIILEQLKETSKRKKKSTYLITAQYSGTYERIDVFRRFLDGRLAEALHVVAELKETSIREKKTA